MNRISISVSQLDSETVEEQGYQTTDAGSRAYQTSDATLPHHATDAPDLAPLAD